MTAHINSSETIKNRAKFIYQALFDYHFQQFHNFKDFKQLNKKFYTSCSLQLLQNKTFCFWWYIIHLVNPLEKLVIKLEERRTDPIYNKQLKIKTKISLLKIILDNYKLPIKEFLHEKTIRNILSKLQDIELLERESVENAREWIFNLKIKKNTIRDIDKQVKSYTFDWIDEEWKKRKPKIEPVIDLDLKEASKINIHDFWGRNKDIENLTILLKNNCKFIAILGEGGIGKTTLCLKFVKSIKYSKPRLYKSFDYIVWKSLFDAPPITDILLDLINITSNQNETIIHTDLDSQIASFLQCLQNHRCLLILDNADQDKLIKSGGYQAYFRLFQRVSETNHRSCLLITSREIPNNLEQSELIKKIELKGLKTSNCKQILPYLDGSDKDWKSLNNRYNGNPYILKIIGQYIHSPEYSGKISKFLSRKNSSSSDSETLMTQTILNWLFSRLSNDEKEIIYWLAINREPMSMEQLEASLLSISSKSLLPRTIESIQTKLPLESKDNIFAIEAVFLEDVIERIIGEVSQEISTKQLNLLHYHALVQAETSDYLRQSQFRLIVRPVIDILVNTFGNEKTVEIRLNEMLEYVREEPSLKTGYAVGNIINLLSYLKTDFDSYDFSGLTIRQAYLQDINLPNVNLTESHIIESVFTESFDYILSVVFSPEGDLLAAGDGNGQIHLWNVATNQENLVLEAHTNYVRAVTFSPDGKLLASGGSDSTIKIWNVETGQCLSTFSDATNRIWSLSFSQNGKLLASGGSDSLVKIWNIETGQQLQVLEGHENGLKSIIFHEDGQRLASAGEDQSIRIWNVNTGECLKTIKQDQPFWSIAFHPNGKTLASSDESGRMKLWIISNGRCQRIFTGDSNERIRTITFSQDGKTLISGGDDCTVRLWNLKTGECSKTLIGHSKWVWSVAFSSDGKRIASGSEDQTIRLWDVSSEGELKTVQSSRTLHGYKNLAVRLAFSCDGKTLASGHQDCNIYLWNYHTGNCIRTLKGHLDTVQSLEFSPDAQILASGSKDLSIKLWDIRTNRCLRTLRGHQDEIWAVAFSKDSQILVSGSNDCTVRIWNTQSGQCQQVLEGNKALIWSVAISPDSQIVASGSDDGVVTLWEVSTGNYIKTLEIRTPEGQIEIGKPWILAFSSDGNQISCSSGQQVLNTWNVQTGELLNTIPQLVSQSWTAGFSPDGCIIANAIGNELIDVWDSETGASMTRLEGHSRPIWTVVLSYPDGNISASSSWDETIKIWNTDTGECLRTLQVPRPYEGMIINGINGLTEAQKNTLISLGAIENY